MDLGARTPLLVGLLCAGLSLVAATVRGATPARRCAAGKLKATARKAHAKLDCHSTAALDHMPVESTCLMKAESAFSGKWERLQASGGCLTANDENPVESRVNRFVDDVVAGLTGSPEGALLGTIGGQRCAAAKLRAASKKARGKLLCGANGVNRGPLVEATCLDREETRFGARWDAAELRGGCATTHDETAVEGKVDALVDDVEAAVQVEATIRVSVASDGTQGDGGSGLPSISSDGRFVSFGSAATNLAAGDTNGHSDTFVRDRLMATTERVSVASDGTQGNGNSFPEALSPDGRFVVFESDATNLVAGDTNGHYDVFVHDRMTGVTERVSVASGGLEGNGDSFGGAVSADGRFVAFVSTATNLVIGDTNGFAADVFVHDRVTGLTERVNVASDGSQADRDSGSTVALSADARFVVFSSSATNLVSGDTNGARDVFVRDRMAGTTERVSVASDGTQGENYSDDPALSADGRFVAFWSAATTLVSGDTNGVGDVFVHDRMTGLTERVSVASDGQEEDASSLIHSFSPAISADGRFVAFHSTATNLMAGDTNGVSDVFLHDRMTGQTERVSIAADGTQGDRQSLGTAISADGRFVAFGSDATTLIRNDANFQGDVFVHDRAGL